MSYDNFKQKVWAAGIETDLERLHVFAADTNRKYEGVIKNLGDTVRIKNVGKPTISTVDMHTSGRYPTLSDPEVVPDGAISVVVDHRSTLNFKVPDIDEAQGATGVMEALRGEVSEGLADAHDKFIADIVKSNEAVKIVDASAFGGTAGHAIVLTKDNWFKVLDYAQQLLFENDVKPSTLVTVTYSPWVNTVTRQSFIHADTHNSAILKNGEAGKYGNMLLRMSNNVATTTDANTDPAWMIQVKTQRAIAFVNQTTHLEPYRPEKDFSDAIKGFNLFGGKVVRPKEIITLLVKPN